MIPFLKKIWSKFDQNEINMQEENASFTLLKRALPKVFNLNEVESIISILAVEYSDYAYNELKSAIRRNELLSFSKKYSFDSAKDAIQLFLFKKKDSTTLMCILFSPVEYLENEYIMDMIDFHHKLDVSYYENVELIFDGTGNS